MRREYINYMDNLPIKVELASIKEYPIHWHESIELLMVIKGNVNVTIESGTYTVREKEIEIINLEEAHRIYSENDNKVLVFHIDPNFFQKYYDDIKNMFFYTDTSDYDTQRDEKYQILRKYLAIMMCEVVQKGDDYDEYIEETLIELLYHLINNFHYLTYEKEELRDNDEQLERYHRIAKYIYNNYNNKISLQDIAKKEFLSTHYLSHEIKNTMGLNFKDFVNLARVEEALKLLLDTDMTITEISAEVGFSHTRYFNKNFKKHYKLTPMQYRKKYKIDDDKLEKIRNISYYPPSDIIDELSIYLEDYDRYNYEERIVKVDIDLAEEQGEFLEEFKDSINLPKAWELLNDEVKHSLTELQKEINFDYGRVQCLFSEEMGIFNEGMINIKRIKKTLDFILELDLRPDIIFEESHMDSDRFKDVLNYFLEYFSEEYGAYEIGKWRYTISSKIDENIKNVIKYIIKEDYGFDLKEDEPLGEDLNAVYDTAYMLPYIIHQENRESGWSGIKAIDTLDSSKGANNEVFFGDKGLLNWEGLKKPSYYAYYFLSKMGDAVITRGDGYLVTKMGDDIQILLYTYGEDMDSFIDLSNINKLRGLKNSTEKNISINIKNIWKDYRIIKYEVHEKTNCVYNQWLSMGRPKTITSEEIELLSLAASPKVTLNYGKKTTVLHLGVKIKGYGAVLIALNALK